MLEVIRWRVGRALSRGWLPQDLHPKEDLVQEIWTILWPRCRELRDKPPEELDRYVLVAADRALVSIFRRERALKRGGDQRQTWTEIETLRSPTPDPETLLSHHQEEARALMLIQQRLPETADRVARLWLREQLTPEEIASRLGVSVQVVYNWQHKIRQMLRGT